MEIRKIDRINVCEQVYEQMLQLITNGDYKPGEKLPSENKLSESFGVSRATLRQAMQKLTAIGLIETRTGEGSFVREISYGAFCSQLMPALCLGENSVVDIMEFRMLLEAEGAARAVKYATPANIDELRENYARMITAYKNGSIEECVEMDYRFHRSIMELSGNTVMIQVHYLLKEVLHRTHYLLIATMGIDNAMDYHTKITEALERRNEAEARRLTRAHLEDTLRQYLQMTEKDKTGQTN